MIMNGVDSSFGSKQFYLSFKSSKKIVTRRNNIDRQVCHVERLRRDRLQEPNLIRLHKVVANRSHETFSDHYDKYIYNKWNSYTEKTREMLTRRTPSV